MAFVAFVAVDFDWFSQTDKVQSSLVQAMGPNASAMANELGPSYSSASTLLANFEPIERRVWTNARPDTAASTVQFTIHNNQWLLHRQLLIIVAIEWMQTGNQFFEMFFHLQQWPSDFDLYCFWFCYCWTASCRHSILPFPLCIIPNSKKHLIVPQLEHSESR